MFSAQKKRENQAEPFIVTITTNTVIQVSTEIEEGNSGATSNHSCALCMSIKTCWTDNEVLILEIIGRTLSD